MALIAGTACRGVLTAIEGLVAVGGQPLLWIALATPVPPLFSPAVLPTPAPPPTPFVTTVPSLGERALSFLEAYWPLVGLGAAPLLIVLAISLLVWAARAGRSRPAASHAAAVAGAFLETAASPDGRRAFRLRPGETIIGRAPGSDLVITREFPGWETVSRRHARLSQRAGRWIVEDLASTNGVYVDGQRTGRNVLYDGCRLGIGGVEFTFRAGEEGRE